MRACNTYLLGLILPVAVLIRFRFRLGVLEITKKHGHQPLTYLTFVCDVSRTVAQNMPCFYASRNHRSPILTIVQWERRYVRVTALRRIHQIQQNTNSHGISITIPPRKNRQRYTEPKNTNGTRCNPAKFVSRDNNKIDVRRKMNVATKLIGKRIAGVYPKSTNYTGVKDKPNITVRRAGDI